MSTLSRVIHILTVNHTIFSYILDIDLIVNKTKHGLISVQERSIKGLVDVLK